MTWRNLAVQCHLFKEDNSIIMSPKSATVIMQYCIFIVHSGKMMQAPDIKPYMFFCFYFEYLVVVLESIVKLFVN